MNFDFKNGYKNEFEDNNKKSCGRFINRVPLKIDFRADSTYESNPTALELKIELHAFFFLENSVAEKLEKNFD